MSDLSKLSDAQLMALLQQQMQTAAPSDDSAARGFGLGLMKPIDNIARAVSNAPVIGPALDRASAALGMPTAGQAYQANQAARASNTRNGMQLAGNIAGTLPTMALPGGALVQGGAGGALLSEADTLGGVAQDAGMGALASKAVQGAVGAVGRAVAPRLEAGVQRLVDAGIPLTPGQAFGGLTRQIEETAMSVPGVRQVIESARDRGTEQFNRTVINRALKNIGVQLPKDLPTGREAVAFMADKVSEAYQNLVPSLVLKPDKPFISAIQRLEQQAASLPGEGQKAFRAAIGDDVLKALGQGQTLSGEGLKVLESRLSGMTAQLKRGDAYQKMVGDVVGEALDELRNGLMRSNPSKAMQLKAVNKAFAEQVRVERAAAAAGSPNGTFTAKQYQAAVKAGDASSRKSQFARGRALNQDISDAAADILPNRLPDSGTVTRAIPAMLAAGASGGGVAGLGPAAIGAGMLALPYTGVGQRALGVMLQSPGPVRRMIGGGIQRAGMAAPAVVPPLLARR